GAGLPVVTGALVAGIIFAQSPQAGVMRERLRALSDSILTPLFLANVGLHADVSLPREQWLTVAVLTVVAVTAKGGASAGLLRLAGATWPAAARVGAGLAAPGEAGLQFLAIGVAAQLLPPPYAAWAAWLCLAPVLVPALVFRFSGVQAALAEE